MAGDFMGEGASHFTPRLKWPDTRASFGHDVTLTSERRSAASAPAVPEKWLRSLCEVPLGRSTMW